MLYDMEMTGWVDHRTRAVITELTVYNPPLNRFVLIQAVLEMPASGAVSPYVNVRTAKLIRLTGGKAWAHTVDVGNAGQMEALVDWVGKELGGADIVVLFGLRAPSIRPKF
jgi:hypothetical protein